MTTPTLPSVNISSNNLNPIIAGITDSVLLLFTASEPVSITSLTINGVAADSITKISEDSTKWSARKKMKQGDTSGVVTFSIGFTNFSAEAGVAVTSTTDSSLVTYNDTTKTLPKFADVARVYQDIGKKEGENTERDDLVTRSDEDAAAFLEAEFLNLVNFDLFNEQPWFVDLASDLTSKIFWMKSNNAQDERDAVDTKKTEAKNIKIQRFTPQEYS